MNLPSGLKYCWHKILHRTTCPPKEDILRAIIYPYHYDDVKKEIHSSLFTTENVSVNRKSVYAITKHIRIFKRNHNKPEQGIFVAKVGQINIKKMNDLGTEWKLANPQSKYSGITIVEKWLPSNAAHAEIVEEIRRGLAIQLIKNLSFIYDSTEESDYRST